MAMDLFRAAPAGTVTPSKERIEEDTLDDDEHPDCPPEDLVEQTVESTGKIRCRVKRRLRIITAASTHQGRRDEYRGSQHKPTFQGVLSHVEWSRRTRRRRVVFSAGSLSGAGL